MRFKPYIRADPRPVTGRRLAAARKTIEGERAKWGMFADQMGTTETAEERIARIDAGVLEGIRQRRSMQAAWWRRARRALFALPEDRRRELTREWNQHRWLPGDAS